MTTDQVRVPTRVPLGRRRAVLLGRILIAAAMCLGLVGLTLAAAERRPERIDVVFPGPAPASDPGSNWLIIGSDERTGRHLEPDDATDRRSNASSGNPPSSATGEPSDAHADMILVVRRDPSGSSVVTIPRDLVVINSRGMPYRIALIASDGPQEMLTTMCHSLGLSFDHLVVLGMEGFEDTVDRLGGVEVTLEEPLLDVAAGIDVTAGTHVLDGSRALALVRSRNSGSDGTDPTPETIEEGTLRRARMGARVLSALGERVSPVWRHPVRVVRAGWTLLGSATLDRHTSLGDLRSLASTVASADPQVLPTEPLSVTEGNGSLARRLGPDADRVLASIGAQTDPDTGSPRACDA